MRARALADSGARPGMVAPALVSLAVVFYVPNERSAVERETAMGVSDLHIVSAIPSGAELKEITLDELAKRLGLDPGDVGLLERSIEDAVKNLTVGDVHATTALTNVSVAYLGEDDDGKRQEEAKAKAKKDAEEKADRARALLTKRFDFTVTKTVPDQRKIFGWASITAFDGKTVVDKQDDTIDIGDLEGAAHEFCLFSRTQGDMHTDIGVGRLIECMVFDAAKRAAGVIAKDDAGRVIDGWWVGFLVDDDGVWEAHKRGERREFSIGGRAQREPVA